MSVAIIQKDIFNCSSDYSFVKIISEENKEHKIKKHKIIYGKYITFGIYKKNFFGSNQWLFNITDFEEGLKELLNVLSINKIKYLAIEATDLNKTNEELLKIIREIFKNVTIKIKIKN